VGKWYKKSQGTGQEVAGSDIASVARKRGKKSQKSTLMTRLWNSEVRGGTIVPGEGREWKKWPW